MGNSVSTRDVSRGGLGSFGFAIFTQRLAVKIKVMRLMYQAVKNRIGQRRVADGLMPMFDGQLAGDDGRPGAMSVIEDFKQVTATFVGQWRQPQSSISSTSVLANWASVLA